MWLTVIILIYCVLIAVISFLGGLLPNLIRLTHVRLQLVMSFVGGFILGVSLLHMLPHAMAHYAHIDRLFLSVLAGVLVMFFLMRVFHIHSHEPLEEDEEEKDRQSSDGDHHSHDHHSSHHHQRGHGHHDHGEEGHFAAQSNWYGLAFGFALHTLMDGIALAASVKIAAHGHDHFQLYGFGIFLAIFLHKPLDAMSIAWMGKAGGWPKRNIQTANIFFALLCPIGTLIAYFGLLNSASGMNDFVAIALAFSAGVFLCISLSDILPEVSFHAHDRIKLSAALLLGVALAWSIGFLEPDHVHQSPDSSHQTQHGDDSHDH